jgi:hypothetical protein
VKSGIPIETGEMTDREKMQMGYDLDIAKMNYANNLKTSTTE